jgi:hypothetical protein
MVNAAVLGQRGEERVIAGVTGRARRQLDHPLAIPPIRLVELLDEAKGQSTGGVFIILGQTKGDFSPPSRRSSAVGTASLNARWPLLYATTTGA